jgi:hypothetical protein
MDRKLTTIVAMDVVGHSHLMEVDAEGTLQRLAVVVDLCFDRVFRFLDRWGDGTTRDALAMT